VRPDLETLSLADLIRLQDDISQTIARRFGRKLALAFSDIVGSTPYFERFGNEAGEGLRQRHSDLVNEVLAENSGRLVDTAGDGAFTCFPYVINAVKAYTALLHKVSASNASRAREHHLTVRVGIHWGAVITDGVTVSGDPVNLCSRVAGAAAPGDVRVTNEAFLQLPPVMRLNCKKAQPVALKGISQPVDVFVVRSRDGQLFPHELVIEQTQTTVPLPDQDLITLGRLKDLDGVKANDIQLTLPDARRTQQISRWHAELRRLDDGLVLRAVSDAMTEVDGSTLANGQEARVRAGSVVVLGNVITLRFVGDASNAHEKDRTF
jgi:class 3 adenylate cyclase